MFQAKVYVILKESILDPQGTAVENVLSHLDYKQIQNVRIGKMIQLDIDESDKAMAEQNIKEICEKILTNPVIENYTYEIEG